jgi:hypothetical protein
LSGFPTGYFMDAPTLNSWLLGWFDFALFGTTLAYVSADAPTFVFSVNADMTGLIEPGMRIRLTQTTNKYFVVTAVGAYAAGVTPITIYGGTDYTLLNAAISAGAFSTHKKPFGFNASPAKWTEQLKDTSNRSQAAPAANTWFNPGTLSLSFPIGAWFAEYGCDGTINSGSGLQTLEFYTTLSTANNSESDSDFTAHADWTGGSGSVTSLEFHSANTRRKTLVLAAKTSYFLNIKTPSASVTSISLNGAQAPSIIRAVCAYL